MAMIPKPNDGEHSRRLDDDLNENVHEDDASPSFTGHWIPQYGKIAHRFYRPIL